MVKFTDLPRERLEDMAGAASQITECFRLLAKTGANVVGELLHGQGEFFEWDHYPKGDVYDSETHAQYYYHAHPVDLRGGEHGHFHTFLRPKGMPTGVEPAPLADYRPPAGDNDALSHLIAISMDNFGRPIRLFTTNRWVTGEVWYPARDVIRMLDCFDMDLSYPSLTVNYWITAMLRLFRPEIEELIIARDISVEAWHDGKHNANVYEDRALETTSSADVVIEEQITRVNQAVAGL